MEQQVTESLQHLEACIEECIRCMTACNNCYLECLEEERLEKMVSCIRHNRECAELCSFAAHAMSMRATFMVDVCKLCVEKCKLCAEECSKHAHEHCQQCAKACLACIEACEKMISRFA